MILIDALYINRSGSKLLLDLLINELEMNGADAFYLLDERTADTYTGIPANRKCFLKAGLITRATFYFKRSAEFSFIFCFGGVPPVKNSSRELWCYFHNAALMDVKDLDPKGRIARWAKLMYMRIFNYNTDKWIVQTDNVRATIKRLFNIKKEEVWVRPFFRNYPLLPEKKLSRNAFLYVSDAYPHKNHERLFKAFEKINSGNKNIVLYTTIDEQKEEYIALVKKYQQNGVNIINLGFTTDIDIVALYKKADCIIFPSTAESLGLGLIEAAQMGLPVIASDLPFVHAVIEPSHMFDAFSIDSIINAVESFINEDITKAPVIKITNHLNWLAKEIAGK